jgi:hypothetical protein
MVKSALELLNALKGSSKGHVTDEELHEVRQKVFEEHFGKD